MSIFSMEQLKSELTVQCMTLDVLDEAQADVKWWGCHVARIDIKDCSIELCLRVCETRPLRKIRMPQARKAIKSLREMWEESGFEVSDNGRKGKYNTNRDPTTKYADVTFDACQIFSTLEEAVRLLVFIMNTAQQVQLE